MASFVSSNHHGPKVYTNRKHGREVCRYWLNSACQKGDQCEFLHRIDYDRMPTCPYGDSCERQVSEANKSKTGLFEPCPFVHPTKKNRCTNYDQGFCSLGNRCLHEHVFVEGPAPFVSPYFFVQPTRDISHLKSFRSAPCTYYSINGWCPYFEMCNFTHNK